MKSSHCTNESYKLCMQVKSWTWAELRKDLFSLFILFTERVKRVNSAMSQLKISLNSNQLELISKKISQANWTHLQSYIAFLHVLET